MVEKEIKILARPTKNTTWIIADAEGRGGLEMVMLFGNKGTYGIIENVFTKEEHRGEGVASKLIDAAKTLAAEKNFYKLVLTCSEELKPFYRKLGFGWQDQGQAYCMRLDFNYQKNS
mgnify:FL=1